MDAINFNHITNLNYSKSDNTEDNEKILIYSDDNKQIYARNYNKFNDIFQTMEGKLIISLNNASKIMNEKKFSCKTLFKNYSNIQLFNPKEFKPITNIQQLSNINLNEKNSIHDNNCIESNNYYNPSNFSSKHSNGFQINLGKSRNLIETKRNRSKDDNEKEENSKELFNKILYISKNISKSNENIIKIENESNELFNDDDERKEIKLVFGGKTIATIYSEKNNVIKIYIHKKEKAITEPKEIHDYLKMIKRDLCKIQEKVKGNN